ncbi:MAG TPA: metal ABC transporter ATP-binding protein [Candidatus Andersenbacteria bacterium]|nr:metal ABC transporter ATP-binding protein [Candidatus Andersenbacteria bacterium]
MHNVDHKENIIECKDVCFSYGSTSILHNVDIAVHRGDYLGIVGPNGGGKTTLLKVMLGLLQPQCGSIKLFGTDIHAFKDWYKIGYVPQKATSFDSNFPATVFEVVLMGTFGKRGILHSTTKEDKQAVYEALKKVEMDQYSNRLIGDLSTGQQQRVFIARALVSNPEVLFLDEPTTGVDESAQKEFYALLRTLNRTYDVTLVFISHDQTALKAEATEIATVNRTLTYEINKPYA